MIFMDYSEKRTCVTQTLSSAKELQIFTNFISCLKPFTVLFKHFTQAIKSASSSSLLWVSL